MQALLLSHSELETHSGLQFGGDPMYVGLQEQDGLVPIALQSAFGPQGNGKQGS